MMQSLMMENDLSITSLMRYAEKNHANQEIVSLTGEDRIQRSTYGETFKRVRKLANALRSLAIKPGERVATMAWNDHRHFELYYAISCMGAICHTVNPRLFKEQIIYIINHAEDCCLFLDPTFIPLLEAIRQELASVKNIVVMCESSDMPETSLKNAINYEELVQPHSSQFDWPDIEEKTASSLCYTSGTTGNPKGVLYSHRSNILHSYASALPDAMNLSAADTVLPVVPMYHANAWGLNYSLPMVGAKLVLPGPRAGDPALLTKLANEEKVTLSAGVPTVWLSLLQYLDETNQTLPSVQRAVIGGAACPQLIIEDFLEKHHVEIQQAWGMTELSPLGTIFSPRPEFPELAKEKQLALKVKQGRTVFGIDLKITDDSNQELPWDGKSFGSLKARGGWVSSSYYKSSASSVDTDGWFATGDIATIDPQGYLNIIDRDKDVIKSGGEWISSIELENIALSHHLVGEIAVIGVPDPKWSERPAFIVVLKNPEDESEKTKRDILDFMGGKVAKWWIPERVEFTKSLPRTATGKISKLQLRKQFCQ